MTQQHYPAQPGYPVQPPQNQQQYPTYPQAPAPQAYPQAPAQQPYPGFPPAQAAPPTPPPAQGTIDDFYNQPSAGGGPSLKFEQIGTRYVGTVTRAVGPGDVQQQTNTQGVPLFFKDGRPKWVMKVPLQLQGADPNAYPDGIAQWYVKGQARDELVRAMAEAGAPAGPPEQGATLEITFSSTRNAGQGMNPAKLFTVVYHRPAGAGAASPAPAPQAEAPAPQPAPQAPVQQPGPALAQGSSFGGGDRGLEPLPAQQPAAQAPQQQYAAPAPVQQQAPAPQPEAQQQPMQAPPGLDPEQAALLARLTSGQQQAG